MRLVCLAGVVSCQRVTALPDPPVRVPEAFSASGKVKAPDRWWTAFGDERLNELVDEVLDSNLDLLTAWDRLRQAEAITKAAGAALWPTLDATASAARTRSRVEPAGTNTTNDFSLGLPASYEVDLWGRVRGVRDAARLAAQASREDVTTTAIVLSAQVATAWFRLLESVGQLRLLDEQLRTNQEYLELVTARFERGQVSAVDVLQQRQLVEATRAEKHLVDSQREVLAHQLAVLSGRPPSGAALPADAALAKLPPLPEAGVPAELLTRRPDVRAAQLRLGSASRDVAAAVAEVRRSDEKAVVDAMGTVCAAREIALKPQVSGQLVEVSAECVPGGVFRKGDLIARVETADYELAVAQQEAEVRRLAATAQQQRAQVGVRDSELAQSIAVLAQRESDIHQRQADLAKAQANLKLEMGQQAVALREYELLGKKLSGPDLELVLRVPQLRTAQATVDAAKAALESARAARELAEAAKAGAQAMKEAADAAATAAEAAKAAAEAQLEGAKLDRARTELRAPFNAVVMSENVDPGAVVSPQTTIATLAGTDEFWVEASVPVDQLRWIRIPRSAAEAGSRARVHDQAAWGKGVWREGRVVRLLSALEPEGRMARLLVVVKDPLGTEQPSARPPMLLLGSYVRLEIEGTELPGVVPLRREHLHDGDRVWVMNDGGKLEIRRVKVAFRGRERVLVSEGLEPEERIVTTPLAAAVEGMPLRVAGAGDVTVAEASTREKEPAQ